MATNIGMFQTMSREWTVGYGVGDDGRKPNE